MVKQPPLWRSTPPSIFPICLALLGLGLGWRKASAFLPIAPEIGNALLGLASAYYLYFLLSYLRKLMARPMVLFEDVATPPARAGISALAMSMMLFAAVLLPFGPIAAYVWWAGVIAQTGASALGMYAIWRDPPGVRQFSTFQYLTFVGPVVGPIAGIPLGYANASMAYTLLALVAYVIITGGLIRQLLRARPPVQLRPSMAIFLAPVCLFASSFGLLGIDWAFVGFYWLSVGIAACLIVLAPWMTKGGWSPLWASFTFPIAAFLQVQVLALARIGDGVAMAGVIIVMAIGTPIILIIAYRATRMWASGNLAAKSGAAQA